MTDSTPHTESANDDDRSAFQPLPSIDFKCKVFLVDHMDPDYGLVDRIFSDSIIDGREMEDVTSQGTSWKKNSRLLECILTQDQVTGFISALRDSDQIHIANYLTANGEYSTEFGEDWPLLEKQEKILVTNHTNLIDLLILDDLLYLLYKWKVINLRQRETISSKPTSHEKNEVLLDILRRRSLRDYNKTIDCLHESKQSHIAGLLEKPGVTVKFHANLDGENVRENETEIVRSITSLLAGHSIRESKQILKVVEQQIIGAKMGQSIVLYVHCETIEKLQQLHELLTSGKFKESLELWFNRLLDQLSKIVVSSVTVSNEELQKMLTYMRELDICPSETTLNNLSLEMLDVVLEKSFLHFKLSSSTRQRDENIFKVLASVAFCWFQRIRNRRFKIRIWLRLRELEQHLSPLNSLPLEMLDAILVKAVLHCALNSSTRRRDKDIFQVLASVEFCWFQRMRYRKLKKRIWCRLRDFYEKNKKSSAILRNNNTFLLENIQPKDNFINSLLSLNCITEEQSHLIKRQFINREKLVASLLAVSGTAQQKTDVIQRQHVHVQRGKHRMRDRNSELLFLMRSFNETKSSILVKCLRQTNQNTAARIVENGGVVIKVEVQFRGSNTAETKQLHENINALRNRTQQWSPKTDKLITQLRNEAIEIIGSHLDKVTAVVWIWCHSKSALEYIEKLYESKKLRDVLIGVANIQPCSSEIIKSAVVSIDRSQFKGTIAVCPISIKFTKDIVGKDEDVYGLTKLKNEIYVLCPSSTCPDVILVFEARTPFRLQKKIEKTEMKFSVDIAPNEKENCLYVSDYDGQCVWKITKETDYKYTILNWLSIDYNPDTLYVCSDGRLLVVNMFSSSLNIYGSDSKLIQSIQLPKDILDPRHAVETSFGTLLIIHRWTEENRGESESNVTQEKTKWGVSEFTRDGKDIIRSFTPSKETEKLVDSKYLSLDSDDQVFVVDKWNHGVVLLDFYLKWDRRFCPTKDFNDEAVEWPRRLHYDEEKKQLLVGGNGVTVYTLSRK